MRCKIYIRRIAVLLALLSIPVLCLYIALPVIVQPVLEKQLLKAFPQKTPDFQIQKIGLWDAIISDIKMDEGILIDSLYLTYHPLELKTGRLRALSVSGMTLRVVQGDQGRFQLQGITLPGGGPEKSPVQPFKVPAFIPENIRISSSHVLITTSVGQFDVPFDVLMSWNREKKTADMSGSLYLLGQPFRIQANLYPETLAGQIHLETDPVDLAIFDRFCQGIFGKWWQVSVLVN